MSVRTAFHVREGAGINETAWDLSFFALGALLGIGGRLLARSEELPLSVNARRSS
jgi:hypothetical protein